jgi:hypothetical protein
MRYLNLNKIALECSKVKNSITLIFNHASIKFNDCLGSEKDDVPKSEHWNSIYETDVVALDFKQNSKTFESLPMAKDGLAVLINLNFSK